jgi:activator of HSP90 ATPase
MSQELKFKVKYRVPPQIIYEALTNQEMMIKYTQTTAKFDNTNGSAFSMYDGNILGVNVDLQPNTKIVQQWKFSTWNEYADLTILFSERAGNESTIFITMKKIPNLDKTNRNVELKVVENGWHAQIFKKINQYLGYPINGDKTDSEDDD